MNNALSWLLFVLVTFAICAVVIIPALLFSRNFYRNLWQEETAAKPIATEFCYAIHDDHAYNLTAVVVNNKLFACFQTGDEKVAFTCRAMDIEPCGDKQP